MSSLLAILFVTQADQSSPSLAFAWPPRPKPTLRLDRPVYKPEQSLLCSGDISFYSGKKSTKASHPSDSSDYPKSSRIPGFDSGHGHGPHELYTHLPGENQTNFFDGLKELVEEEEDSALPQPFYTNHAPGSQASTRSSSPMRSNYLGFEPDAWADMLTPRIHASQNLLSSNTSSGINSGRKFELVIDALAIIAHPVLVNQKPTEINTERSTERGRTRTRSGEQEVPTAPLDSSIQLPGAPSQFLSTVSSKPTEPSSRRGSSSDYPISINDEQDLTNHGVGDLLSGLSISASSPVKPPAPAPISQLTRMMTPSAKSIDQPSSSTSHQVYLHPQSTASLRSNSSPSPVALPSRAKTEPRYDPITYSPMGGFPLAPTVMVDNQPQVNETFSNPSAQLAPLQSFTLALIIDTPPASHLSQHLEVYYKDVVLKLTAALKHLERKSSYLTREVQAIMRKLSDRRNSLSCTSITHPKQLGIEEMMKFLEKTCDLPRALARTFTDLKTLGSSSITLDEQLDLDLLLHLELLDSHGTSDNCLFANGFKSSSIRAGDQDRFTHLESWKSLLLLEDPQLLVEQTAPGSLLRDFITIIKPALTLSEYKFLLDTDSNTIADMTDHLLYWRKAKITDMITLRNSYQLTYPLQTSPLNPSSSSNTLPLPTLQHEFAIAFPNLPNLVMILSLISQRPRQPFLNILPILDSSLDKCESMAVLVWLLKRDLLMRERTHVRIKIDRDTRLKVALWEQEKMYYHKGSDEENYGIDEQSSLSPESQPKNESNQTNKQGQFSSPLSLDKPHTLDSSSSSLNKTASIRIQQQPVISDQPFSSSARQISPPHGLNRQHSSYRGSQSFQPRSINSVTSPSKLDPDRLTRQQSVQSDFSRLSGKDQPHDQRQQQTGEFHGTTIDGFALSSHQKLDLVDIIIGEPGQATATEQKWLDEICADKTDFQIRSFNLAFKYFNGRYPLEEIISRSGLSRKALNEVLIEFQTNLILIIHP